MAALGAAAGPPGVQAAVAAAPGSQRTQMHSAQLRLRRQGATHVVHSAPYRFCRPRHALCSPQLAALLKVTPSILESRREAMATATPRGIMISAAWGSHLANTFVNLYVLRHTLGCKLPVAVT